jgi:hypothetical protein
MLQAPALDFFAIRSAPLLQNPRPASGTRSIGSGVLPSRRHTHRAAPHFHRTAFPRGDMELPWSAAPVLEPQNFVAAPVPYPTTLDPGSLRASRDGEVSCARSQLCRSGSTAVRRALRARMVAYPSGAPIWRLESWMSQSAGITSPDIQFELLLHRYAVCISSAAEC